MNIQEKYRFYKALVICSILLLKGLSSSVFCQQLSNPKFSIQLTTGYSHLFSSLAEDLPFDQKEHIEALKSGFNFGGSGSYHLNHKFKLNVDVDYFISNHTDEITLTTEDYPQIELLGYSMLQGTITDSATLLYLGPSVDYKFYLNDKWQVNTGIGIGYIWFSDRNTIKENTGLLNTSSELQGGTFAPKLGVELNYRLSEKLFVGAQIKSILGYISKLELKNSNYSFDNSEKRNISRMDFNLMVGIKL